jgi:hypothetical protein
VAKLVTFDDSFAKPADFRAEKIPSLKASPKRRSDLGGNSSVKTSINKVAD